MRCSRCGAEIGPGENFCFVCGADLPKEQSAQQAPAAVKPEPQPEPMEEQLIPDNPIIAPTYTAPQPEPQPASTQYASADQYQQQQYQAPPKQEYRDPFAPQPGQGNAAPAPGFFDSKLAPIVSMGNWFGTFMILMFVPIVIGVICGIVSGFVQNDILTLVLTLLAVVSPLIIVLIYAFNKKVNPSKRNFFKAYLLLLIIVIVLVVVLCVVCASLLVQYLPQMEDLLSQFDMSMLDI